MSRNTATVSFQALELKGSLLPASLLEEVSKLNRPKELLLEGHDYGLSRGERLRDRIDAAWVLAKELWEEYGNLRERAGQSTAGLHFGLRLLKEVFGWSGVEPCQGWQHGQSRYPITHRAFDGAVPLILRGIEAGDLDRGSKQFGQDERKRSPHSCLQECLNADDNANWGVLLSGDRLRLLHDNPSLVKPAYLAADLELMIEGERFDEFSVPWLLLHASRFQHPKTGSCVLDDWKKKAEESGERVLGALRGGVQSALESLGWGFLNHPANGALREALQSGQLSRQQFHEQLLRLVYRFLFLFTAEDRDLLFPRELKADDPRRRIYREGYSVSRLRELAIKRSAYEGDYGDLWELQRLVFQQLSIGNSPLGLPGLGGLFSLEQCPDLQAAELWNGPLLRAIKAIGWFDAGGSFTRVRYRDLNTEELGSVYEGLLELHPQLEQQGSQWQLSYGGGAGSDRKTTGSYYTPDALVQELIKSALIPVIDDRLSKAHGQAKQEQALLKIKVIDPACGSGHFLLAAARRLAVALAQVRAGDDQPSEEDRQHALRDVVAHCIYAVDRNPMAVELCKVALWIEAIDPGKPLSFLDAHILCGDSLVGVFDPKVLEEGIPDEAYKQLTGDNKTVCTSLKKENAAARKTISRRGSNRGIQGSLDLSGTHATASQGQQALQAIEAMPETTLAETAAKQAAYAKWLADRGRDPETLTADLYTAAFFLAKNSDSRATVPTTEHLLKLLAGQPVEERMEDAVVLASQNFRFFHWHLRFGQILREGGFDCLLANPPYMVPPSAKTREGVFMSGVRFRSVDYGNLANGFWEASGTLLGEKACCGFVYPKSITFSHGYKMTRFFVESHFKRLAVVDTGIAFKGVGLEQVLLVGSNLAQNNNQSCDPLILSGELNSRPTQITRAMETRSRALRFDHWPIYLVAETASVAREIYSKCDLLGDLCATGGIRRGCGWQSRKDLLATPGVPGAFKVLGGKNITSFTKWSAEDEPVLLVDSSNPDVISEYEKFKDSSPRIVCKNVGSSVLRMEAAIAEQDELTLDTVNNIILAEEHQEILPYILGCINSSLATWVLRFCIFNKASLTAHFDEPYIKYVPIPRWEGLPWQAKVMELTIMATEASPRKFNKRSSEYSSKVEPIAQEINDLIIRNTSDLLGGMLDEDQSSA